MLGNMLVIAGFLIFGVALAEDIYLQPGKIHRFTTPTYPNIQYDDPPGELTFRFKTKPGSKIVSYCEDFRPIESRDIECDYFELNFNDGVKEAKHCKTSQHVYFISYGPTLTAVMKFKFGQHVSCLARSTEVPISEKIVLTPEKHEFLLESPSKPFPYMDQAWTFKSSNGDKVSLNCETIFSETDECYKESFMIDNGSEEQQYCHRSEFKSVSTGDTITFHAVFSKRGHSFFRCYATIPRKVEEETPQPDFEEPPMVVEPTHHEVTLRARQTHKFESPGYPYGQQSANSYNIIHIKTSPGSQIQITCDDIRMSSNLENPCDEVELKFKDRKSVQKVCRTNYNVYHISTGHTLDVEMKFKHQVAVSCLARTTEEPKPTEIELSQYDRAYHFRKLESPVAFYDNVWIFKSKEKTKISLQCDIGFNDGTPCSSDFLTVHTGSEKKVFCGGQKFVIFSNKDTMKVRIQLDKYGHESYFCIAQAVTGPNANQHENVASEQVDSSERGGKPGKVATTCNCGKRNHVKGRGRIFNGKETQVSEYTWMVGIRNHDNAQRCGGSLISQYHVLTAAHCMVDEKTRRRNETRDTVVVLGAHNLYEDAKHGDTQYIDVREIFIPEEYWNFGKNYDLSVLFLAKAAVYGPNVGPVCMPKIAPKIHNQEIKVTGWGWTKTQYASPVLLETKLFVLDNSICSMDPWFICTYKNHTSSCKGDSGSPLVHWDQDTNRYFQVSLVSYGKSYWCGVTQSGNSNVTYHYQWINGIVKRTMPSVQLCTKL